MIKYTNTSRAIIVAVSLLAFGFASHTTYGQSKRTRSSSSKRSSRSLTKDDTQLLSLFKPVASSASESTVKIQSGHSQIAVGTIIDENGLILTKASEMRGTLTCRLPNGDVKSATVQAIDIENDLALLKIEAEGLAVAELNPVPPPTRGALSLIHI